MRTIFFAAVGCMCWLSLSAASQAGMVLGNMSGNDLAPFAPVNSTFAYSVGFTMGGSSVELDSFELRLKSAVSSGTASVELRADSGGNPASSPLVTFSDNTISAAGFASYTFTPDSPFTLLANTTYWMTIVNNFASPDGLSISASNPNTLPTGLLASYSGLRFGTVANQLINLQTSPAPNMQLNGTITAVPEPATLGLLGLTTIVGAGCWRRRKVSKGPVKVIN